MSILFAATYPERSDSRCFRTCAAGGAVP